MTMTLLAGLLPKKVQTAEVFDDPDDVFLFAEEETVIARAMDNRRREFTTVRHCARQALAALGRPAGPLLPGERGAPIWPDGVVGSMTHCTGYRAAAVADRGDVASLGIDAEPHGPLPDRVVQAVALPRERRMLAGLARREPSVHWGRLLFSAKESVYKAWFPLTRTWLGFEEAEVEIDPVSGAFHARLLKEGRDPAGRPLCGFDGRWLVDRGLALTAIAA